MEYKNLTDKQKKAFDAYKNSSEIISGKSFAYHLNSLLLDKGKLPLEYEDYLVGLDEISGLFTLPNDQVLYRACFEDVVKGYLDSSSKINVYPAYLSTSTKNTNLSTHFASGFSNLPCYLEIHCKAGAKVIPLEKSPAMAQESEILLPRGSSFKLISISQITDKAEISALAGNYYGSKFSSITKYVLHLV
ncbi:ADP-ribosyltransferase [Shewanella algae]|uniref:ADP-ribosyltransferase n=1 Tax=Shewanella algae TaxID=38313 RepID=UPI0031F5C4E3